MNESEFDKKIGEIKDYLEREDKKCLVINGSWGIGKTYLWKQVEKKFEDEKNEDEKNTNKEIVYIDLFGKESYKQILEEIVFKLYGKRNEALKEISKLVKLVKLVSTGLEKIIYGFINIGFEALFSLLEKKDFKNIIVCFDNIERKSDNLALKDIIGLVNLLKEDKECNVVMIFNKEELNKLGNKESNLWYETYKEKFVDYEFYLNNNEVARHVIKTAGLHKNIEDEDNKLIDIIFKFFKQSCNNNLRLLFKFIEHIRYFNQKCFIKYYNKNDESFFQILEICYQILLNSIKKHYSIKFSKGEKDLLFNKVEGFLTPIFESYFRNFFNLSREELRTLTYNFQNTLKNEYKENYLSGNLNDREFAKCIKNLYPKFKNNIYYKNITADSFVDCKFFYDTYKKITKKELDYNIGEFYAKAFFKFKNDVFESFQLNRKYKGILEEVENLMDKEYYKELEKEKCKNITNDTEVSLENEIKNFKFSTSNIEKFNEFEIDSIEKYFQKDYEFYKIFYDYFKNLPSYNFEKYDLNNNLFQAYKNFLNKDENKIKKEFIRKILGEEHPDCLLLKLLEEQPCESK